MTYDRTTPTHTGNRGLDRPAQFDLNILCNRKV